MTVEWLFKMFFSDKDKSRDVKFITPSCKAVKTHFPAQRWHFELDFWEGLGYKNICSSSAIIPGCGFFLMSNPILPPEKTNKRSLHFFTTTNWTCWHKATQEKVIQLVIWCIQEQTDVTACSSLVDCTAFLSLWLLAERDVHWHALPLQGGYSGVPLWLLWRRTAGFALAASGRLTLTGGCGFIWMRARAVCWRRRPLLHLLRGWLVILQD